MFPLLTLLSLLYAAIYKQAFPLAPLPVLSSLLPFFFLLPTILLPFFLLVFNSATWISSLQPPLLYTTYLMQNSNLQRPLTRRWSAGSLTLVRLFIRCLIVSLSAPTGNWLKNAKMPLERLGRKWLTWWTPWTAATPTRALCMEKTPWLWHSWTLTTTTTDVGSQTTWYN